MIRRSPLPAILTVVLVAAAALLAVHDHDLWQHLDDPIEIERGGSAVENAPASPALGAFDAPPLAAFSAVTERPLFTPTRRPFQADPRPAAAPPAAAPPEGPAPIEFSLVGVALSEGERVALVRRQEDGEVFRVTEGGEVLGWVAASIGRERAIFRRGDREERLELEFGASSPAFPGMSPFPSDSPDMGTDEEPELSPSPDQDG